MRDVDERGGKQTQYTTRTRSPSPTSSCSRETFFCHAPSRICGPWIVRRALQLSSVYLHAQRTQAGTTTFLNTTPQERANGNSEAFVQCDHCSRPRSFAPRGTNCARAGKERPRHLTSDVLFRAFRLFYQDERSSQTAQYIELMQMMKYEGLH